MKKNLFTEMEITSLKNLLRLAKNRIYVSIKKVNKAKTSRNVNCYMIYDIADVPYNLNFFISGLLNEKLDKERNSLILKGSGFDTMQDVCMRLSNVLFEGKEKIEYYLM